MEDEKLVLDKDIIKGIQCGGVERDKMFKILMLQTDKLLHAYLVKKFGLSLEERGDIITDSYVNVDKQIYEGKFRGEASLKNYLHTVAYREACSYFRIKNKRPEEGAADEEQIDRHNAFNADTMGFVDEKAEEDCLVQALESFYKKQPKSYFQLTEYSKGYKHKEWVERYGGTVKSSKTRVYDLRKLFREFYDRFCGEGE